MRIQIISIPYLVYRKHGVSENFHSPYMWVCQVRIYNHVGGFMVKLLYFTVQADIKSNENGTHWFSGYIFTKPEDSKYYISNLNVASKLYTLTHNPNSDSQHTPLPYDQIDEYINYINHPSELFIVTADELIQIKQRNNVWS